MDRNIRSDKCFDLRVGIQYSTHITNKRFSPQSRLSFSNKDSLLSRFNGLQASFRAVIAIKPLVASAPGTAGKIWISSKPLSDKS
jgi:hypothetical protein